MDGIAADPAAAKPGTGRSGEGSSPLLALGGFSGRLEQLLILARAHQIDLARILLPELIDQLTAALRDASGKTPLGEQGDWVVMATWLVLLRSRLLLPPDTAGSAAASAEAARLRYDLVGLDEIQALATWLDRRPQLGHDVFPRGQPELVGIETATAHQVDVIEFLWASLALFDDDLPMADTAPSYRPTWLDVHAIADARDRILRRLADHRTAFPLEQLLPDPPGPDLPLESGLRGRSRWTSTFVASLELAKQGDVLLDQGACFSPIHVSRALAALPV